MDNPGNGMEIIRDAPCCFAVFESDGGLALASELIKKRLPPVRRGLNATLNSFDFGSDHKPGKLPAGKQTELIGRRPDGAIWKLSFCYEPDSGLTSLHALDITQAYREILRRKIIVELAEVTPDGIAIAREDRSGFWLNPAMQGIVGTGPEDDISQHRIEEVQRRGFGSENILDALERAKKEGVVLEETVLNDIHGKNHLPASQVIASHYDSLLDEFFFSTIVRDISEQKETQRELEKARSELELLLELKDVHLNQEREQAGYSREVWRSLVEQNQDLVLFTNEYAQVLFANQGFMPDGASSPVGSNVLSMVVPGDRMAVHREWQRLVRGTTRHINLEARIICPNDELRYCTILVNRLETREGRHAATWILSDASETRRVREQLQAQEKMAATGRMAARIAHEINNPLAAIKSSLELVRMDTGEDHPAARYLELMDAELDRVSRIIRQMYGLYRTEDEPIQALNTKALVRDCLTLLESSARQQDINLQLEGSEEALALASEPALRQILFNALQNALDVSPAGGTIRVVLDEQEGSVRIRVLDDGPGIEPEHAERIFEPFFTTKSPYSGSGLGLGLSVSASLAKAMGGILELENRPEGGAEAIITLPADDPEQ